MFIVVGVTGGIAAYKSVQLVRLLVQQGHDVHVIPTEDSLRFIGLTTWEAISRNPVTTSVHDGVARVRHVALGQSADLVIVAPATANTIASMAAGLASDLLGTTLLATTAPVVVAPAMHTEMWRHPATAANVATLSERGVLLVGPADGPLTGGDSGPGRMSEPEDIVAGGGPQGCPPPPPPPRRHRPGAHGRADRPRRPARRGLDRRHPRTARPRALPRQPVERSSGRGDRRRGGAARRHGDARRGIRRRRRSRRRRGPPAHHGPACRDRG